MKLRQFHPTAIAAAKASISPASACRIEKDPRLPSGKQVQRERRRPDPLASIFDDEVIPLLQASPGIRAVAIFEEMIRRHPERDGRIRRTLERRIRSWRALHGLDQEVIFRQVHQPGQLGQAATDIRDILGAIGLQSWPLVSGGKRVHVVVPLVPEANWDDVKSFCHNFAELLAKTEPHRFIANMSRAKRKGRMFLHYLRNGQGSTAICPW
ncbi:hypothetical protein [Devosia sp. MC521]|uniref:non-homologous end-joining DNA ligase LigD n=1 Tax=Devosia sp. MC521 TaxID=2759954 RepID=UPI0015FD850D|nr:hypothetical protein [Devosia sp. MC521]QMW61443.1 hypothetical protein H4N61_10655 [Devosia sp. MC521]